MAKLTAWLPTHSRAMLSLSARDFVEEVGIQTISQIVKDVLLGHNLRDSTEQLTRRRLIALNLALVDMFIAGTSEDVDFVRKLPELSASMLIEKIDKQNRQLALWVLGLTDKQFQNVLRDKYVAIKAYADSFTRVANESIKKHELESGPITGSISFADGRTAKVNWEFFGFLLTAIGAQTLAIRGSDKSAYGKLFERLMLGSLLHLLGFEYIAETASVPNKWKVFWLSSRKKKRETDATILYSPGQGVGFDIGFIGRGNPEITLDKVSRIERNLSLGNARLFMTTIIIVDTIGEKSGIKELAKEIDGHIVQMSMSCWPKDVAEILSKTLKGYKHPLVTMSRENATKYIERNIGTIPIESFLTNQKLDDV